LVTPAATVAFEGIPVMMPSLFVMLVKLVNALVYPDPDSSAVLGEPPAVLPPEMCAPDGHGFAQLSQPAGHVTWVSQSAVPVA
jgi:hypothetical protein